MRFRFGLVLGSAVGYVLGSKAGRQRYEQIMDTVQSWRRSDTGQQIESEVRETAQRAGEVVKTKVNEGADLVEEKAREGADFVEDKANESVAKVTELTHKDDDSAGTPSIGPQ